MDFALQFLSANWLGIALLGGSVLLLWRWVARRRFRSFVGAAILGFPALGSFALPASWAAWLLVSAGIVLISLLIVALFTGRSSKWFTWVAVACGLLAPGGLWIRGLGVELIDCVRSLLAIEFVHPAWLGLLVLIPVVVYLARRNLDWQSLLRGRVELWRPWVSVLLRCGIVALLALALAEPRLRQPNESMTVLFVLDRSRSIPEDFGPAAGGGIVDRRWARLRQFINDAVRLRGVGRERDRAGLIVFGRKPRLELPPSDAPRFNLTEIASQVDGGYTDIAAALKFALASFPEGTGKRIVLISDGNENLGNAEEQARLAASLGVRIDVLPVAAGLRNEDEVLVERVDIPPLVEQGAQVPIRVLIRSYNPNVVVGLLTVKQITEDQTTLVGPPVRVKLHLGLNAFSFTRPLAALQRSYTYEAEFQPERIEDEAGLVLHEGPPPGDRPQNNRASAHVVARGRRRILILENQTGDHSRLAAALRAAGKAKF